MYKRKATSKPNLNSLELPEVATHKCQTISESMVTHLELYIREDIEKV